MNELLDNGRIKRGTWSNFENHIIYAKWLGEILGYTKPEDWYKIKHKDIKNNKGSGLLSHYYNDSPIKFVKIILKTIYPEYEWFEWKFDKTTQNYWDNIENQKDYMNWLFNHLEYNKIEDWYNLNANIIGNNNGSGLLHKYSSSHIELLKTVYSGYEWLEWKFKHTSINYWRDKKNCKKYTEWLGKILGYTELHNWYNISQDIIHDNYGATLLGYYNGSPIQFLKTIYPDYEWLEWKFNCVSRNYWTDKKNHKLYAEWLGKILGYNEIEHWYNITCDIIGNNSGGGLLVSYYNGSPIQFVRGIFPDYKWLEWKFGFVSKYFWKNVDNHKLFVDWLGKELGYTEPEHWYCITQQIINNNYGNGILGYYNDSPKQFLKSIFPDYEWIDWKFEHTTNGFWQDTNNHKLYADWLGKELGYTKPEDWYDITQNIINNNYGCGLISNYYNNSPIQFLREIYPHYEWLEWKFKSTSNGYWQDINNHKTYAEWLGKKLGYTKPDDWYDICYSVIKNNCGCGILHYYNSYTEIPKLVYPEYEWDKTKFYIYKTEAILYNLLITIYPTCIRQFTPEWVKPKRFDFCIPEYKIIIELDGRQHFIQVSNWSSPESQFENDKYKEKCANDNGYSVIRLLQEDVFDDTYDWFKELCDSIEDIKHSNEVSNIYLDSNEEYSGHIVNSQI